MITGTEMVNIRHECLGFKKSTSEEWQNCTLHNSGISQRPDVMIYFDEFLDF